MKQTKLKPGRGFAASPAQREKVRGLPCRVCDNPSADRVDPAHVIPRGIGGRGTPEEVVPLCRPHHDAYDKERTLDLLPHLTHEEQAKAVETVGLITALQRITNRRWAPSEAAQ